MSWTNGSMHGKVALGSMHADKIAARRQVRCPRCGCFFAALAGMPNIQRGACRIYGFNAPATATYDYT